MLTIQQGEPCYHSHPRGIKTSQNIFNKKNFTSVFCVENSNNSVIVGGSHNFNIFFSVSELLSEWSVSIIEAGPCLGSVLFEYSQLTPPPQLDLSQSIPVDIPLHLSAVLLFPAQPGFFIADYASGNVTCRSVPCLCSPTALCLLGYVAFGMNGLNGLFL